jgi:hypothetical protein
MHLFFCAFLLTPALAASPSSARPRMRELARLGATVRAAALSSATAAAGDGDGHLGAWPLSAESPGRSWSAHDGAVLAVALSTDGARLWSAGADGAVRLWSLPEANRIASSAPRAHAATALALSSDGRRLWSGSLDGTIHIFDASTLSEISSWTAHDQGVCALALASDGAVVISAGLDGRVRLWDARTGAARGFREAPPGSACDAPVAAGSGRLLSADGEGWLRLWDRTSLAPIAAWRESPATALAADPRSERALTGGADGRVLLWDISGRVSPAAAPPEKKAAPPSPRVEAAVPPAAATALDMDVDDPPRPAMDEDPDALAVVVGVEDYRAAGRPPAAYAEHDARSVHAFLTRAMGFPENRSVLLLGAQAGKADLDKYWGPWLANRVGAKSRVVIYFAGHGVPAPDGRKSYLLPYDGDPAYAPETAISLAPLLERLAALPARSVLVVLDACFSGAGARSASAPGQRPLALVRAPGLGGRVAVLSASGPGQASGGHARSRHGLLTYFFLRGLKGEAGRSGDGAITLESLHRYLAPLVAAEARLQNLEQEPGLALPAGAEALLRDEVWRLRP